MTTRSVEIVPKVSVCLRTYNQVDYVEKTIESVLCQKTDFPFELVVGDDGSTDGTLELIRRYRDERPDIVRLLPPIERLGGKQNLVRTILAARGQYVALLDGDDYWTSDRKLQMQADFLDGHPDIVLCGHRHEITVDETGQSRATPVQMERATLREFLASGPLAGDSLFSIGHLTVMARRTAIPDSFPDWFYDVPLGDKAFQLICGLSGDFGFINEVMAVYRKHGGAQWSVLPNAVRLEGHVLLLEKSRHVTEPFRDVVENRLMKTCVRVSHLYLGIDQAKSREFYDKARRYAPSRRAWAAIALKRILRDRFPRAYRLARRTFMTNRTVLAQQIATSRRRRQP